MFLTVWYLCILIAFQYCNNEKLDMTYQKTKVIAFAERPKLCSWYLNQHNIEQMTTYKYLGVVIHATGLRKAHCDYAAASGQRSANAILFFFSAQGEDTMFLLQLSFFWPGH